jgi:prepilin-type N-terminal cleavage/methylation domain-containing protein
MPMKTERRNTIQRNGLRPDGRSGFTLIEMMIALGLMALMLAIIFIPLNQAFSAFRIGQARADLQQAGRQTLDQMARELRTAVRVFPNDVLPGVTDGLPYNGEPPYLVQGSACSATGTANRVANTARIDFIPADVDNNGNVVTPVRPGKFLVTYYARRSNPDLTVPYDPVSNPVVLFRAQSPIRYTESGAIVVMDDSGSDWTAGESRNVDTSANRYTTGECTARGSRWLYQNASGEPIGLGRNTVYNANVTTEFERNDAAASHTQLSPRGMSLTLRDLSVAVPADLKPNTWFTPEDSNGDGKIDRVTISLSLDRIDAGTMARSNPRPATDANPSSANGLHRVRLPLVVDLPNVM